MAKFVIFYDENSSCSYHRVYNPFRLIDSEDNEEWIFLESKQALKKRYLEEADVLIFNRHPGYAMKDILEHRRKRNFKIWVDMDDYWDLYRDHYLYESWAEFNMTNLMVDWMRQADIVTVTNARLAAAATIFNSNIEVIPNAVPMGYDQFICNKVESNNIRFLMAGGASHYLDYKSIQKYFISSSKNLYFRNSTEFILAGYSPTHEKSEWLKIEELMEMTPKFKTRPLLPLNQYMRHYDHADVLLAPLEQNRFNAFKSNLKTIEAGSMRIPIICTAMFPYLEDEIMRDKGIFFCNDPEEWYRTSLDLVRNPAKISDMGENLYQYVSENYDLVKVNKKRRQILTHLKNK